MSGAQFERNARVKVIDYGVEKKGRVTSDSGSGIVFVRMEGTDRVRWFHRGSLERDT